MRTIAAVLLVPMLVCLTLFSSGCERVNTPPTAGFAVLPVIGNPDTIFTFNASSSSDNEDDQAMLEVHWDFNNDGVWDTEFTADKKATFRFSKPGDYTIAMEVRDAAGLVSSISRELIVVKDGSGIFTDSRDGHVYRWMQIGDRQWMAENLAYLPSIKPTSDNYGSPYWVYDYNGSKVDEAKATANYKTYGVLYSGEAALKSCPPGWHLPTNDEWISLVMAVDSFYWVSNRFSATTGGKALKSTKGWLNNRNGINSIGFTVLSAGRHTCHGDMGVGSFIDMGVSTSFYSSIAQPGLPDDYLQWFFSWQKL
jgi:uncharacterized protein (TIGR02145 family)